MLLCSAVRDLRVPIVLLWVRRNVGSVFGALLSLLVLSLAAAALSFTVWTAAAVIVGIALIIGSVYATTQNEREADLRSIEDSAYQLAGDLRMLADVAPAYLPKPMEIRDGKVTIQFPTKEVQRLQAEQDGRLVRLYNNRFAALALRSASDFRRHGATEDDVFFRLVSERPKDAQDIFQIAAGLERIARQIREGHTHE